MKTPMIMAPHGGRGNVLAPDQSGDQRAKTGNSAQAVRLDLTVLRADLH